MSTLTQSFGYSTLLDYVQTLGIPILDFINHLDPLNIDDHIGSGGAMDVYKGLLHHDSHKEPVHVALKIPRQNIKESSKDRVINEMISAIRQEIRIMKHLETHPYVVNLYGISFRDLKPILVVELATESLNEYLISRKASGNRVDWETKWRFCYQIANGIMSLHAANIVHGDIKADNILLFGNSTDENELVAKLSDFGYSSTISSIKNGKGTGGTFFFFAPECTPLAPPEMRVFANKPTKDNYSYGLYVWQVATDGEVPYEDMDQDEIEEAKHSDRQLLQLMNLLPEDTPASFKQVIRGMTQYVPNERNKLKNVKPLITGIDELDLDTTYAEAKKAFEVSIKNISQHIEGVKLRSLLSMSIPSSIKRNLVRTYEMEAENGDPEKAYFISVCYGSEFGVKLDKTKMISWAIKAAEGGCLEAVQSIAFSSFDSFEQLPDNRSQLFPWLQKTAEAGHMESQYLVSQCYLNGVYVEKSEAKYMMWYMKYCQSVPQPQDLLQSESPLHCAAREGNLEAIRFFILQEKMNVDTKNSFGATPLQRAAVYNRIDAIKLLVDEFKADVDAKDNNNQSILHSAAHNGHIEIVKLLITKPDVDINVRMKGDWTPLHLAAKEGHVEIAKLLVTEFGADVNIKAKQAWTPLHSAVQRNHIKMAKLLIVLGAEVNVQDKSGWTPLYLAAQNGNVQMVRLLAKFGADVDAKTNIGLTPFHSAAENGHMEIVEILVAEFRVDVNAKTKQGWTPLHYAAQRNHIEIVKMLIVELGVDVNVKDNSGWTPLHLASKNGYVQMVMLLVAELGAIVDIKGNDNWTPLYLAAENGYVEIVKLLGAKFGADVNIKKNDGWTPLHSAIERGHIEIVKLLVEDLGANMNDVGCDGLTPLAYSVSKGNVEVVATLLKQSHAEIHTMTKDGRTLLHLAVKYRREVIVKMLVEQFNLNIYTKDANGQTPLGLADEPPVHFNFFCNGCDQEDIIGERYRCRVCTNFDFCSACYSIMNHSYDHRFEVIELPSVKYLLVPRC